MVAKRIQKFSYFFELFVDFCYENSRIMTPLDTTKNEVRDNIFGIILHNEDLVYDQYWYILNKQNVSEN
jgi:hypothetical protein